MHLPFTLRQLEYLEALAFHGSIAKTSKELHISPSSISSAIDSLENAFNVTLFQRQKAHGVHLTLAGADVLLEARALLNDARAFAEKYLSPSQQLTGHHSIGFFPTLVSTYSPVLIKHYRQNHPLLFLDIEEASVPDLQEKVLLGKTELAVFPYDSGVKGLNIVEIDSHKPHVLLPEGHPLAQSEKISIFQLLDLDFVAFDIEPSPTFARQIFEKFELHFEPVFKTKNLDLVCQLISINFGFSIVYQKVFWQRFAGSYSVVAVEIEEDLPSVRVGVAHASRSRLSAQAELSLELLRGVRHQG